MAKARYIVAEQACNQSDDTHKKYIKKQKKVAKDLEGALPSDRNVRPQLDEWLPLPSP